MLENTNSAFPSWVYFICSIAHVFRTSFRYGDGIFSFLFSAKELNALKEGRHPIMLGSLEDDANYSVTVTAEVDAERSKFLRLFWNGEELDPANYELSETGVVITLKDPWLTTLQDGTYSFKAEFSDGQAALPLTIRHETVSTPDEQPIAPEPPEPDDPSPTGGGSPMFWVALCLTLALGLLGLMIWGRHHRTRKRNNR